jgi:hypothetical protein
MVRTQYPCARFDIQSQTVSSKVFTGHLGYLIFFDQTPSGVVKLVHLLLLMQNEF